jgi:phytoene/squalene synthetase
MLKDQALLDFLDLALRGYTVRRIRELMEDKGYNINFIPDAYLVNLIRDNAEHLAAGRGALDEATLAQFGLASKMERVRRLCEAAEVMESLVESDTKWSGEYRRYLDQIKAELEPLGITFTLSDSWAQLLTKVAEAGRATTVDESDVETTKTPD